MSYSGATRHPRNPRPLLTQQPYGISRIRPAYRYQQPSYYATPYQPEYPSRSQPIISFNNKALVDFSSPPY